VSTASATEFIDMVDLHRPHVAWIDLMIGDDPFAGIEVINQVRQIAPETHCMVYTQFNDSLEHFVKAVRAGASAFLPKSRMHDFRQLRDCIMRVALGEQMLDPILLRRMAEIVDESRLRRMADEGLEMQEHEPTQGELRVLEALARDRSNPEIAQELVISINTVKTHLRNLYGKTGAHNRTELLLVARSRNWLRSPDDQPG
jgi:DNA-binding NarL/FixJ family response regulator